MNTPFSRNRIATAVAGLALALGAGQALGAGFALQENSGSGLGNAYAGGAAAAEDAATLWSNAAGMSRITTNQVVAAINFIKPSMKFSNSGSLPALACPPSLCPPAGLYQPLGGEGGDAGSLAVVPNLYLVVPINKAWSFGLGINAPFGLVTEYDDGWMGRYQAIKSDVKTLNINPALSWKVSDNIALGGGVSYQQIKATFTSDANYSLAYIGTGLGTAVATGALPAATANAIATQVTGLDSGVTVTGDDWAWGWNVGILVDFDKNNRFGAAWRSDISYKISGNVNFANPALPSLTPAALNPAAGAIAAQVNASPLLASGGVTSDIKLPGIANFSWFGHVSDRWDLMADVQWTHWSTLKDLTFVRTTGVVLQSTPENFKDTWRYSLGANYQFDNLWKFRMGVAYDQSPVQDAYRTARLPDSDRTWLALGAQYAMSPAVKLDLGATYIWVKDGSIAQISTNPASIAQYGYLKGNYSNNVVVVSGQVTWNF
jgi:long-chain fatty acid transport protein